MCFDIQAVEVSWSTYVVVCHTVLAVAGCTAEAAGAAIAMSSAAIGNDVEECVYFCSYLVVTTAVGLRRLLVIAVRWLTTTLLRVTVVIAMLRRPK